MGYTLSDTLVDENQHVYVKICELGGVRVELVGLIDEKSPIGKILKNSGVTPYHICYEVPDLKKSMVDLRAIGYIPITRPMASIFEGRDVVFLYHPQSNLVELIQQY
jgi:methylmalonyl-CoA/ethylmalonyl-CoA epimerase